MLFVYTDTVGVNSYDYDAYGNAIHCSEFIYNPIRYAGYYYDADTENYYLKNRYYDSSDARFLTVDPYWNVYNMLYGNATSSVIRNVYYPAVVQSGNRFVYCAGKPIAFVDPSGTVLEIKCDRVNDIIEHISYLTHDDLRVMPKLDENGNPTDTYVVEILQEKDGDYDVGTELVRRLVKSEYTCIIFTDDRNTSYSVDFKNSTNGIGSDVEVEYNPDLIAEIPTYDYEQKGVRDQPRPAYIGLAHELIHADRAQRGVRVEKNQKSIYFYREASQNGVFGKTTLQVVGVEELATVGLKYNTQNDITENMIRAEHGLPMRGAY